MKSLTIKAQVTDDMQAEEVRDIISMALDEFARSNHRIIEAPSDPLDRHPDVKEFLRRQALVARLVRTQLRVDDAVTIV